MRFASPGDMVTAVSAEDVGARRKAITKVASSPQRKTDWAIDGYEAISLLEADPQTRCIAIRALARSEDTRAAATFVRVLTWEQQPAGTVRAPDPLARADATQALAFLSRAGKVPETLRTRVEEVFLERLRLDSDANVRMAAARGLGDFASEPAIKGLIAALADQNFAVAFHCEDSLVRLTGRTHRCDRAAWEAWFEQNRTDLFAARGQIPPSRQPIPPLKRFERETRDRWSWIIPFDQ